MAYAAQLWSINGLASELNMDRRTIAKRIEGLEPDVLETGKRTKRQWRMASVFRYLSESTNAPLEEKARLDRLRGDKIDHDLEIAKGQVGSISLLSWALSGVAERINSSLDALPLRLKKRCPKLNARNIEDIRRTIVKLQNEISEVTLDSPRAEGET